MSSPTVAQSTLAYLTPNEVPFQHTTSTSEIGIVRKSIRTSQEVVDFGCVEKKRESNSPTFINIIVNAFRDTQWSELEKFYSSKFKVIDVSFGSVSEESDPSELRRRKLIGKLHSYSENLEPGWDGYEGIVPSKESSLDAIKLYEKLEQYKIPFHPQVSSEGEVGLYYEGSDLFIDFSFLGDGQYSVYAECQLQGNTTEILLDCQPIEGALNEDIEVLLSRTFSVS